MKNLFIYKIIRTIAILIFLIVVMLRTTEIISRVLILPFLFCSILYILKNICLLNENKKYANIFNKLFIIIFLTFWFGFLVYWCFLVIKNKNYLTLLFTIPLWIVGIYIIRRSLFGIKAKAVEKTKHKKINFPIVISSFLVLTVLVSGIIFLGIGIKDTYKLNKNTKGYITTNGYFKDYEIYNISTNRDKYNNVKKHVTYKLTYVYEVNGKKYTVDTDYGVGYIPEKNSIREVKYNPDNPNKAILVGTNGSNFLIYFGAFFILGSLIFILAFLYAKGIFDKVRFNVMGTFVGLVFVIVGIGLFLFQNGTTQSFMETVKSMGLWILIPIMFVIIGGFQTIKSLFFERVNIKKKKYKR